MTGLRQRLQSWLAGREKPVAPPPPAAVAEPPPAEPPLRPNAEPELWPLAEGLGDEAPCPDALLQALAALVASRRAAAGVEDGPASPALSGLSVRRSGLPDWWEAGENLLLAGPEARVPELKANPFVEPPRRCVLALGAASRFNHINLGREGPLVVLGDRVMGQNGAMSCLGRSSVMVGEGTSCTNWAMLDCRNGGIILTGADGMWAHGVSLMTDDTHAIRDAETGRRVNTYGGRIVVGRHVWLCEQARILEGARVGDHSIVGAYSMMKRSVAAPNSVVAGIPARTVRSGVVWSREDEP